jgi:hypothetical protein
LSVGVADVLSMEPLGASRAALEELHALESLGDGYAVYVAPPPTA